MEIPELVGLGQISNEESERDGMAMLGAFAYALEVSLRHEPSSSEGPDTHVQSVRCDSDLELHSHPPSNPSRHRIPAG